MSAKVIVTHAGTPNETKWVVVNADGPHPPKQLTLKQAAAVAKLANGLVALLPKEER